MRLNIFRSSEVLIYLFKFLLFLSALFESINLLLEAIYIACMKSCSFGVIILVRLGMKGANFQLVQLLFTFIVEVLLLLRDIVQIINYLFNFRCSDPPRSLILLQLILARLFPTYWLFLESSLVEQVMIRKVVLLLSMHTYSSFLR